jgi:alpha-beta hydrolase superfamily lysophospholipase
MEAIMETKNCQIESNYDGLVLDVLTLIPAGESKGIIQLSHGMAEHKERYIPFMEYLTKQGYITIIHDHRGHGKSVKEKQDLGYFGEEKAEYVVEDLHQITKWIKSQFPQKKVTLFGHSMGSMIVRKYIKKYDDEINQLIVCGSPSKNPYVDIALLLVKLEKQIKGERHRSKFIQKLAFGSYNQKIEQTTSTNSWICSNPEIIKSYDSDELCGFIFTLNGFQNLFTLMKEIYSPKEWKLSHKTLPILFIAGEDDPVIINPKKWKQSQIFLRDLGYQNISYKLYPKMRHEIINEKGEKVWEDIFEWIKSERNKE